MVTRWILMQVLFMTALGQIGPAALAETIELVTYYPVPGGQDTDTGRLHADRATIGDNSYSLTNPADLPSGTLLVADSLGVGAGFVGGTLPAGSLHVVGPDGGPDRAVFVAGAGGTMSVGIGTAAPTMPLEVYLADESYVRVWGTGVNAAPENFAGIELGSDLPANGVIDRIWQLAHKRGGAGGLNDLHVNYFDGAAWRTRLMIQPAGNVGIGTTAPTGRLHVQGVDDGASTVLFMPGNDTAAAGTPVIRVGIGTNSPAEHLDVAGNTRISGTLQVGQAFNGAKGVVIFNHTAVQSSWQSASGSYFDIPNSARTVDLAVGTLVFSGTFTASSTGPFQNGAAGVFQFRVVIGGGGFA